MSELRIEKGETVFMVDKNLEKIKNLEDKIKYLDEKNTQYMKRFDNAKKALDNMKEFNQISNDVSVRNGDLCMKDYKNFVIKKVSLISFDNIVVYYTLDSENQINVCVFYYGTKYAEERKKKNTIYNCIFAFYSTRQEAEDSTSQYLDSNMIYEIHLTAAKIKKLLGKDGLYGHRMIVKQDDMEVWRRND